LEDLELELLFLLLLLEEDEMMELRKNIALSFPSLAELLSDENQSLIAHLSYCFIICGRKKPLNSLKTLRKDN